MKAFAALLRPILCLTALGSLLVSCTPTAQVGQQGIVPTPVATRTAAPTKPAPQSSVVLAARPQSGATSRPQNLAATQPPRPAQTAHSRVRYAIPARYTATRGEGRAQGGQFDYLDESGKSLTDGLLGGNDVLADLGRGAAREWIGWGLAQPRLEFFFPAPVRLQRVQIRFNRNDRAFIGLPARVVINGKSFAVNPKKLPDRTSGYLSFEGPFSGRSLKVEVTRGRGWVFSDEARFVLR